jgi:amino acid transporter
MAAQEDGERLGTGNLTLPDVVAQSVGYMGPVFSGTFFIPTIVGLSVTAKGAGIASPFAILLTAIGMLALAWIISRYAKRIHAAGALYDYVGEGFGRPVGLFAGWVYYGGALMLTLAIGLAFGGFVSLTLAGVHGVDINWIWFTVAFWIVAWAISVLGVQISTRAQLVLALVSVAVIFGWALYVILKGGSDGFSLRPFNPGESDFTGITYGIVYAGLIFVGFESAANLAEETAEPKRNIPRAIFYSVLAAGIFYVILAWALVLAFGLNVGELLKSFPPLYVATANPEFGGDTFGDIVQWLVVIDIAAVGLGTATGTARGFFALARDRHLPSPLAAVHPKYKTPYIAASVLAVMAIVVAIIVRLSNGLAPGTPTDPPGHWFPIFQFGATIGAFLLFIVYLLIALTGFKGQPGENRAGLAFAGVLAGATAIAALYGVVHKAPSFYWFDKVWWLALIWVVIGIGVVLVAKSRGNLASHAPPIPD